MATCKNCGTWGIPLEDIKQESPQERKQRRERIAAAIMAGIYAGINANQPHSEICAKTAALCAVSGADALIEALEAAERGE